MESSNLNLDLHHPEDHLQGSSSSSLALQGWNQDLLLNSSGEFSSGALSSSRDRFMRANGTQEMPMVQDLGFQWGPSAGGCHGEGYNMMNNNHSSSSSSHQGLGFHNFKNSIRDEQPISDSFAKLTGINLQDYNTLLPNSTGFEPMNLGISNGRTGSFSMVLPTANVSGSGITQSLYPSSLGMDLQALDLLASVRFGQTMSQPSLDSMGLLREDLAYCLGQLQEPPQAQVSTTHHKASLSVSGVTEAKRSNNLDSRTSQPAAVKKRRFDQSRSPFTTFKVRKEKLGDRIAALQQLVAPFGKTDTASVLMEAIGYIKFLQDQVETLSVPYMRSSNSKKTRTPQGGSSEGRGEPKPDLRSRGLCLVPLSCMSYVANDNGGVWSPPTYRGGT